MCKNVKLAETVKAKGTHRYTEGLTKRGQVRHVQRYRSSDIHRVSKFTENNRNLLASSNVFTALTIRIGDISH